MLKKILNDWLPASTSQADMAQGRFLFLAILLTVIVVALILALRWIPDPRTTVKEREKREKLRPLILLTGIFTALRGRTSPPADTAPELGGRTPAQKFARLRALTTPEAAQGMLREAMREE